MSTTHFIDCCVTAANACGIISVFAGNEVDEYYDDNGVRCTELYVVLVSTEAINGVKAATGYLAYRDGRGDVVVANEYAVISN